MSAEFAKELRRRRAQACDQIWYGTKPSVDLGYNAPLSLATLAIFLFFFLPIVVFIGKLLFQDQIDKTSAAIALLSKDNIIVTIFFSLLLIPYLKVLWQAIRHWRWPNFYNWQFYSSTKKTIATVALGCLLAMVINDGYKFVIAHHFITPFRLISTTIIENKSDFNNGKNNQYHERNENAERSGKNAHNRHKTFIAADEINNKPIEFDSSAFFGLWGICSLLLYLITARLAKTSSPIKSSKKAKRLQKIKEQNLPFGLWLGKSTGTLSQLSHGVGMASGQEVALFGDDACQNILILGATGSGKTTRVVQPLLLQLLEQGCGGLIFDIKGDFQKAVSTLSAKIDSPYTAIGASEQPFNLLAGLITPEIASSFLKSAFLLNGSHKQDGFWVDTATELCRNVLGMLSFIPEHYSLHGLYSFLFDRSSRNQHQDAIDLISAKLEEAQQRLLRSYQHYYETIFSDFDEKVQAGVKATIAQVLAPFNHPELIDAFCKASPDSARLEDVLDGQVFLVNMPLSRWGLGGKVVYTFIKLRFFNVMQRRVTHQQWNQDRFVFFLCDEYQEIVSANKDGLSDLNFWDKSRSSKTIGIISTQSVSSFYAAIGDRDMANALLQNFRQKICFRTEDETTIALMNRLLGTVEIQRISTTHNSGKSSSWEQSSSHSGESTSISTQDKLLLDGQFFRTLPRDHALALLSLWGNGCDDVLKMDALFP